MTERHTLGEGKLTPGEENLQTFFGDSYYFSMGGAALQRTFFSWARSKNLLADFAIPEKMPPHILSISLPKAHIPGYEVIKEDNFTLLYDRLHDIARNEAEPRHYGGSSWADVIASEMVGLDGKHVAYARHYTARDRSTSFVREHIFNEKPARSRLFNQLFTEVRQVLVADMRAVMERDEDGELTRTQEKLYHLKESWEEAHPGEKFVTEEQLEQMERQVFARSLQDVPTRGEIHLGGVEEINASGDLSVGPGQGELHLRAAPSHRTQPSRDGR